MSEARYLGLLNEVKRLRADMQHSSNEGGRVDPLQMLEEFKDFGFTDDFGVEME